MGLVDPGVIQRLNQQPFLFHGDICYNAPEQVIWRWEPVNIVTLPGGGIKFEVFYAVGGINIPYMEVIGIINGLLQTFGRVFV